MRSRKSIWVFVRCAAVGFWLCSVVIAETAATRPADQSCTKPCDVRKHYEPTWESLKQYCVPQWYLDAKFGIFIHWGVYAVPAHGSEWYPRDMYIKNNPIFTWHREHFGPQSQFGYKDFIPKFTAAKWDPDAWAALFVKAGAKYVVPVAEHHDGFPMYDCSYSQWTAAKMGPKRDILGELAKAIRKRGLVFGASSHRARNWMYYPHDPEFDTSNPEFAGLYGPTHDPNAPASREFLDDWLARTSQIVDKYQPDLMWFDSCFGPPEFETYRRQFAANYYNRAAEWGREVVINYKHEAFPEGAAVLDIERGKFDDLRPFFWQTDTSVDRKSWGYIADPQYKTVNELVDDLVDIVSKNGCLLLNIGPRPDGTIPEEQQKILLGIGQWLSLNGEAIYGTRPWKIYGEGPTQIKAGYFAEKEYKPCTAQDIRFTTKGDALYAICLDWPQEQVRVRSLSTLLPLCRQKATDVQLIGSTEKLQWSHAEDGLTINPPAGKPCEHAFAFKITFEKQDNKNKK